MWCTGMLQTVFEFKIWISEIDTKHVYILLRVYVIGA